MHRFELDGAVAEANDAGGRAVHAGKGLDERRFAGAVLAEQHVDLAHAQVEIDGIERDHSGEMLAEALRPQQHRGPGRGMGGRVRVQRCRQQRQTATSNSPPLNRR